MIPGDAERIADFLGGDVDTVAWLFFVASPGAVVRVKGSGENVRVGTITPGMDGDHCRFLDVATGKCRIHPVAPFGCAYFDTHMGATEGARRSLWGVQRIAASREYHELREELPVATSWRPSGYEPEGR